MQQAKEKIYGFLYEYTRIDAFYMILFVAKDQPDMCNRRYKVYLYFIIDF